MTIVLLGGVKEGPIAEARRLDDQDAQFIVGPTEVLIPRGIYLLVRKGRDIGAVRFTDVEQGTELGVGKSTYESYFQGDGSGPLLTSTAVRRTGEVNLKPLSGVGRLSFQLGQDKIRIGPWTFGSGYPGRMDMWPYRGESRDYGYEFAPTSAKDVHEIDASNKQLRWFRYDSNASVKLRVSDLPK